MNRFIVPCYLYINIVKNFCTFPIKNIHDDHFTISKSKSFQQYFSFLNISLSTTFYNWDTFLIKSNPTNVSMEQSKGRFLGHTSTLLLFWHSFIQGAIQSTLLGIKYILFTCITIFHGYLFLPTIPCPLFVTLYLESYPKLRKFPHAWEFERKVSMSDGFRNPSCHRLALQVVQSAHKSNNFQEYDEKKF